MNQFIEWLSRVLNGWKFWIVVPPWDVGIRIRLGKTAHALSAGLHLRIPLIDEITLINTRLRMSTTPSITLQATHGRVRARLAVFGYRVADPLRAILAFEHPTVAVTAFVCAEIVSPAATEASVCESLKIRLKDTGLEIEFVRFTEDIESRVLRIMQGNTWVSSEDRGGPVAMNATPRY